MTTLGQIAFGAMHGDCRKYGIPCMGWDEIGPVYREKWEHTACAAVAAAEPGMETMRAELERVRRDLADAIKANRDISQMWLEACSDLDKANEQLRELGAEVTR